MAGLHSDGPPDMSTFLKIKQNMCCGYSKELLILLNTQYVCLNWYIRKKNHSFMLKQ